VNSSLTTALEEMTINNEQLRSEADVLKTNNMQLNTLLDKMAINNDNQMQQINTLMDQNKELKAEVQQLKVVNGLGLHGLFTYVQYLNHPHIDHTIFMS